MRDRLIRGLADMGLSIEEDAVSAMLGYLNRVLEHNRCVNLTRIIRPVEAVEGHLLDALSLLAHSASECWLPKGGTFCDIGCGAGFPGIPLLLARPDARGFLFDAARKRIDFVVDSCTSLGIRVDCAHGRAEDFGHSAAHRERYDLATARAVASAAQLCEWALPLVKIGGYAVFYKGPAAYTELADAAKVSRLLGGGEPVLHPVTVPGTRLMHILMVVPKLQETPERFPRSPSVARRGALT